MTAYDVSVAISQGSFRLDFAVSCEARALALYGPSGSGKTSVLEVIAGIRRPRRGRVAIGGRVLFDTAAGVDVPTRHRRVGYVPQDALLFPHLDVRRNILYGSPDEDWSSAAPVVERLGIAHLAARPVADLSGGERQRVALSRALASKPDILLLDEPLAALDRAMKRVVLQLLVDCRDQLRLPIVYVTHVSDEAIAIADQAVVLGDGVISSAGPAGQLLNEEGL
jgi:molybdate transport system ATP-binding protein